MQEQITINFSTILAICGIIVAVGGAIVYIYKAIKTALKPFKDIKEEIEAVQKRCDEDAKKFLYDDRRIRKLEEAVEDLHNDTKAILSSVALLLQHAETGNNTGEMRKGRQELEKYLIKRK